MAPNSVEEYNERFATSQRIEGFGLEMKTIAPCPFCAAPDFAEWPVMTIQEEMAKDHVCKECGRGAKALVQSDAGGVQIEFVQTSGPDQPEWLHPKMRRVD